MQLRQKNPLYGQGEIEPLDYGRDHGRSIELGTALKNLSEYGKRHDGKVIYGTGETLPTTSEGSNIGIYKGKLHVRFGKGALKIKTTTQKGVVV